MLTELQSELPGVPIRAEIVEGSDKLTGYFRGSDTSLTAPPCGEFKQANFIICADSATRLKKKKKKSNSNCVVVVLLDVVLT